MTTNERHFCMAVGPRPRVPGRRAALVTELAWQTGQQITVEFLGGSGQLRARVREAAAEWTTRGSTANLELVWVDSGPGIIRISFEPGDGSWSVLGRAAERVDPTEATMNFGWLTDDSDDEELRRVVLHEFGHALGLVHEHQNPNHPIDWNRAAVIAALSRPPNEWDAAAIQQNMFDKYEPTAVVATRTDPESIMIYPIPMSWTNDGFTADFTTTLSTMDRDLISRAYPW